MNKLYPKILIFLFYPYVVFAQEFNYIQYDTKDGLAGSTVYDMCQDKDGFMWFATSNGLSRYDGTAFKNFTVKEGLPDNDVLKLFSDSRGRLWIGSFSKELCYYHKGTVYNKNNCSWLKKIALKNAALTFCEDETGTLLISDLNDLIIKIDPENEVSVVTDHPMFKEYKRNKIYAINNYFNGGFYIVVPGKILRLNKDSLEEAYSHNGTISDKFLVLKSLPNGKTITTLIPDTRISQTFNKHTTTFVNTVNGAWSIDTFNNQLKTHFLPGRKISCTVKDREENIWFSTLGEGVYRLPSLEVKTITPFVHKVVDREVFSLAILKKNILSGLGFSKVALIDHNSVSQIIDYGDFTKSSINNSSVNKLYAIKPLSTGTLMLGFDAYLIKRENEKATIKNITAIKSIDEEDSNHIIVGNYNGVYSLSIADLKIIDTIYKGRCTKVFCEAEGIYIGTINGLYQFDKYRNLKYLGDLHSALSRRITDIKSGNDNIVWVATGDAGVVAYKNGKVIRVINEGGGLSSDICKSLYVDGANLFIGTSKGLNKVNLYDKDNNILKYSVSDGLPSDIINAILIRDSIIYVGSPKGLSYFNEKTIANISICNLQLLNVNVSGVDNALADNYSLSYNNNNISFSYVAISFKSGGDITYHYKLDGLDEEWKNTRETNLIYQTLPPGSYTLHLYAVNKFGVKSDNRTINFTIETPFWKTWWAYALGIMSIILITAYLFNRRNKLIQQRLIEKNNFQRQFATLEQ